MKTQKKPMLWLAATFLLPLLLAWLVLKLGWYQSGALSHGQWLEPPLQLDNYPRGKWSIAQVVDGECAELCQQNLAKLNNAWLALGIAKQKTLKLALTQPVEGERFNQASLTQLSLSESNPQFSAYNQQWLLVDPTGWVILAYQPSQGDEQVKGLITDLKKLIKNSRFQ